MNTTPTTRRPLLGIAMLLGIAPAAARDASALPAARGTAAAPMHDNHADVLLIAACARYHRLENERRRLGLLEDVVHDTPTSLAAGDALDAMENYQNAIADIVSSRAQTIEGM